jgi:lysophospholipase L1-like esterase
MHYSSYLALGDSYTIGESVPLHQSFPYQVVQLLRKKGLHFYAPEIVAKTGWTTTELAAHILHTQLNPQYDFVSLLIGVNNQYRGLSIEDFKTDFDFLLKKALQFSGNKPAHVIVLSIPDWGFTPFAAGKDIQVISKQIDAFNAACSAAAQHAGVHYINITDETRAEKNNLQALASDQLHYSGATHLRWAEKVAGVMGVKSL